MPASLSKRWRRPTARAGGRGARPETITHELIEAAARQAVKDIGYEQEGFHWEKADVKILHPRAVRRHRRQGVDAAGNKDEGAGDQGIMFGYACRETDALMPAPIHFSHGIAKSLAEARHSGAAPLLGPDAKSQVTLQYENGKPVRATSIVVSTQHRRLDRHRSGARDRAAPHRQRAAAGLDAGGGVHLRQPDRPLRDRRSRRRRRPDRPQDHRRHLRRCGPPWRRRLLRQGPDQGRPLGRLCRALSRQERGRRRTGRALHHPARLCHRRVPPAGRLYRHLRHRQGGRGASVQGPARNWST